jgi:HAD superfamily hydrolase (TIGR01549 family)
MIPDTKKVQTIIFDFDGTIANTFDATLRIANELASEFGYRRVKSEDVERLRSSSYREITSELGIAWHKIPRIAARIRKELSRTIGDVATFEGLPQTLSELRGRGLQLGILTSNDRANVERFLGARHLSHFDFVATSASVWGKERRLRSLLRSRKLNVREVAYVGDEVRDIQATKPLGICMIAVGWGYTAASLLAAHEPDHLATVPPELLDIPALM